MAFQDFHKYNKLWANYLENQHQNQIQSLLDGNELILFFVKDGEVFGAQEDSRVTFARMKHPTEDDPEEWAEEATFGAFNLTKALQGQVTRSVLGFKDLRTLRVIDRDEAEKLLNSQVKQSRVGGNVATHLSDGSEEEPGVPANATNLKDKK